MADEEGFSGCVDEHGCEGFEVVEALNACDLGEESVDETEVAAGDADDGRAGGGLSDSVGRCVRCGGVLMGEAQGIRQRPQADPRNGRQSVRGFTGLQARYRAIFSLAVLSMNASRAD